MNAFAKPLASKSEPGENQVNTLIYAMGDQADDIFLSFELTTEEENDYNQVKGKFVNHFIVKRNVIFERAKFNSRIQREGESVDSFITDLYGLARYCNFGAWKDELIRDPIVVGLRNRDLSERLQLDPKLTLEKATNLARQRESVKNQQSILDSGFKSKSVEVDSIAKGRIKKKEKFPTKNSPEKPNSSQNSSSNNKLSKCSRCLGNPHPKKVCPARLSKCRKCQKIGHWAQACKSSANPKSGTVSEAETEESFFLGEIVELDEVQSNRKTPWTATISVNGKPLLFKLDSGADVSVIPRHNFLELSQARLQPTTRVLLGPCKYRMNCKGVFRARLTNELKSIEEDIYVVEDLARPLLGRNAAANLKLISRVCELTSDDYKAKVMHEYPFTLGLHYTLGSVLLQRSSLWDQLRFREIPKVHG